MQANLDLDDGILEAAHDIAQRQGKTTGQLISDLVRQAAAPDLTVDASGVPLLPMRPVAQVPDLELVNRLRDGE